jgi:hypothetical protein
VIALVMLLVIAFAIQCYWFMPSVGAEADAACYLLTAKNMATHGDPAHQSPDPAVFVPEHMVEVRPGVYYPIYPVGYPALCALAYAAAGPYGPFLVNPILVIIGLAGVFFLARQFLSNLLAVAATAFLALHPTLLYYGVIAMSHAAEFALATWCLACTAAWYRRPRAHLLAIAAVLVSAATSVRYTGALLALPVAYVTLLRLFAPPTPATDAPAIPPRRVLAHGTLAAVAGLLALLPLLAYLRHAFGSPFTTGYALTGEAGAFSPAHFLQHAPYALKALSQFPLGLSLLFPIGLAGILFTLRRNPRLGGLFAVATLPTLLMYSAYYWFIADPAPWWQPYSLGSLLYLRFFLGMFPMLVIAALRLAEQGRPPPSTAKSVPAAHAAVAAAVLLLAIVNISLFPRWDKFVGTAPGDLAAVGLVSQSVPPNAVIVAHGYSAYSLLYWTDMTVYYPRYFAKSWIDKRLAPATATRPADYDPLRRARMAAVLGNRSDVELFDILRNRLTEHARAGQPVFLVSEDTAPPWYLPLNTTFHMTPVAANEAFGFTVLRLTLKDPPPPVTAPAPPVTAPDPLPR